MPFELIDDRLGPDAQAVHDGLRLHREAAVGGPVASRPLCLVHRDDAGRIVAGLVGEVVLDWLYVEKFWVDDSLRGQGLGTRMLAEAEALAAAQGAIGAHLNTNSYQAPAFYRRHGYTELGRLADRPRGHLRHWFAKRFDGADPRGV